MPRRSGSEVPSYFQVPEETGAAEETKLKREVTRKVETRHAAPKKEKKEPAYTARELADIRGSEKNLQVMQRRLARQTESLARYSKINTPKGEQMRDKTLAELQQTTAEISRLALELRARKQGVSPEAAGAAAAAEEEVRAEAEAQAEEEKDQAAELLRQSMEEAKLRDEELARREEERVKSEEEQARREEELLSDKATTTDALVDAFPDKGAMADRWQGLVRILDDLKANNPDRDADQDRSDAISALKKGLMEGIAAKDKAVQRELARAAGNPEKYFDSLTDEVFEVKDERVEDSDAYKDLYKELGAVVGRNDVDGAIAFKEKLRKMSRGAESEMQAAAKLLWDKLQEVETPKTEDLLEKSAKSVPTEREERVRPTVDVGVPRPERALFGSRRGGGLEAAVSYAVKEQEEEKARLEAQAKADEAGKRYEERVAEFRKRTDTLGQETAADFEKAFQAGEARIVEAGEAAKAEIREGFSKEEAEWFAEGGSEKYQEIQALAEAMGAENIRDAVDMLKSKVEVGERITEHEAELLDRAHKDKIIDFTAEDINSVSEQVEEMQELIAKEKKSSWRNRIGVLSTKGLKDLLRQEESLRLKLAGMSETLDDLWKGQQTMAGVMSSGGGRTSMAPKSILGLKG